VKPLIEVTSLSFSYGETHVLEDISLMVKENDFIAIIGPNGSGKTTLVKVMLGILAPTGGTVTRLLRKHQIGYVPQRYTIDKNFPGTVKEILATQDKAGSVQAGIDNLLNKKFISLSGGQQQRVLIALALQQKPKLLILDEPTAGVDIRAQQTFYGLLRDLNRTGIAVILVTHEVGIISSLVKTVICINHKVCCMGKPEEMPRLLKKMYGEHVVHHHHKGFHHD